LPHHAHSDRLFFEAIAWMASTDVSQSDDAPNGQRRAELAAPRLKVVAGEHLRDGDGADRAVPVLSQCENSIPFSA
jgi:hypothetical protein